MSDLPSHTLGVVTCAALRGNERKTTSGKEPLPTDQLADALFHMRRRVVATGGGEVKPLHALSSYVSVAEARVALEENRCDVRDIKCGTSARVPSAERIGRNQARALNGTSPQVTHFGGRDEVTGIIIETNHGSKKNPDGSWDHSGSSTTYFTWERTS